MIPIEFLRQYRIFGYAIFDFVVAFLGMYLLAPFLTKVFRKLNIDVPKRNWLILTLPISILAHLLVGRITSMTAGFLDLGGHYFLKIFIVFLLIWGLKDIKIIKKKTNV